MEKKVVTKNVNDVVKANVEKFDKRMKEALAIAQKCVGKDADTYSKAKASLESEVKSKNIAVKVALYSKLCEHAEPIKTAISTFNYTTEKVQEKLDDKGGIVLLQIVDTTTRIDMSDFVKVCKLNDEWLHDCNRLLALLQLRKTDLYNMTDTEMMQCTPYFIKKANEKLDGGTPDSNRQVEKLLQAIVDATIGADQHKVTVHDVAFLEDACYSYNKKAYCGIRSMNAKAFYNVVVSVLYRMLTNSVYEIQNAKVKVEW